MPDDVPAALVERRKILRHDVMSCRERLVAMEAELAGIDLAIEAYSAFTGKLPNPHKERNPRRDVIGMVRDFAAERPAYGAKSIAKELGLRLRQVESALTKLRSDTAEAAQ